MLINVWWAAMKIAAFQNDEILYTVYYTQVSLRTQLLNF